MEKGKRYLFSGLFVALLVWLYLAPRDFAEAENKERLQLLCDAFTIPGVLLLCAGALGWLTGKGALDGLRYALRCAIQGLLPGKGPVERYGDYLARKRTNRTGGYGWLLLSGGVTVGVSLLFLALYCLF